MAPRRILLFWWRSNQCDGLVPALGCGPCCILRHFSCLHLFVVVRVSNMAKHGKMQNRHRPADLSPEEPLHVTNGPSCSLNSTCLDETLLQSAWSKPWSDCPLLKIEAIINNLRTALAHKPVWARAFLACCRWLDGCALWLHYLLEVFLWWRTKCQKSRALASSVVSNLCSLKWQGLHHMGKLTWSVSTRERADTPSAMFCKCCNNSILLHHVLGPTESYTRKCTLRATYGP